MAQPPCYQIKVKGHLPPAWSCLLNGLQINCEPDGSTILSGPLRDQAELYGLIERLCNLGLDLVSINPSPDGV